MDYRIAQFGVVPEQRRVSTDHRVGTGCLLDEFHEAHVVVETALAVQPVGQFVEQPDELVESLRRQPGISMSSSADPNQVRSVSLQAGAWGMRTVGAGLLR